GERARERHAAGQREPGRDADHVGFRDAEVEGAPGEFLGEARRHGGLRQVGVEGDDALVLRAQLDERLSERDAAGFGRHRSSADSGVEGYFLSSARSSLTMAAVALSVSRWPCQAASVTPRISRMA